MTRIIDHVGLEVGDIAIGGDSIAGFGTGQRPTCYGAFVFDPDGHNIEAVCHGTE